ncbi:shikimate kinase [Mechercharimyces sp. CAU 1602]|uniref:shikimate kinase n=1 Tax=Mechercharimyces sp. CAU 1602 TaxID=2973933 RepID=UPI0021629FA8|nr:shikimate kinase [Mechercharimyces sp. CAU 1602]MCS1350550.1 shikimate kinase [Mechercharimyces sp. CAU 1602]
MRQTSIHHIILIGFMGTGKTSVGKCLATAMGRAFIDTDNEVERKSGKSINAIFAEDGETHFRKLETETLHFLAILSEPHVIATGGGIAVNKENIPLLQALGWVVALTASEAELIRRLRDASNRPLLLENAEQKVYDLLQVRRDSYKCADWTMDTTGRTVEEISTSIRVRYEQEFYV